jgi:hypothetical protein
MHSVIRFFHLLKVLFTKNSDNSLIFIHFLTHTKRIYLSVQFVLVTILVDFKIISQC